MKRLSLLLVLFVAILTVALTLPDMVCASTVDVSVVTDKSTYQLGETVEIFVTAYNPNPQAVTLTFVPSPQATYLMDDTFERSSGLVIEWSSRLIDPYSSYTWNFFHTAEMTVYSLEIGNHTVAGEVIGYGWSTPVQFEVVPEPCTLAILGFALPFLRAFSADSSRNFFGSCRRRLGRKSGRVRRFSP